MAKADNKTKPSKENVTQFLNGIENEQRRKDCKALAKLMGDITGEKPKMWGPSIVGFGEYSYKYETGREGDWFLAGFSPRKQALTLYIMGGFSKHDELMAKLGPHTNGKSCLYVKKLDDLHQPTLKKLITESVKYVRKNSRSADCAP